MLTYFTHNIRQFFNALSIKNTPLAVLPYLFKWILISSILALVIGSASALFLISLQWVTHIRTNNLNLIYALPFVGFMIGYIYHKFGNEVEGGNNLIIKAIQDNQTKVPFIMAPLVYITTLATHLFGGSAGREGTALQMAGGLSFPLTYLSKKLNLDQKSILIAAVAGGFGSVFGTPIAGTFFALEFSRIGKPSYKSIFPALSTALLSNFVTKLYPIQHTHYFIEIVPDLNLTNLGIAIISGICFGITAFIFSSGLNRLGTFFKNKIKYPPFRPFLGGLLLVFLFKILNATEFMGLGIPIIQNAFTYQLPLYFFAYKIGFTLLTLASGFKGGEVTPLFFIGSTLGNALGQYLNLPISLLAGMGFVAVFAGAANTPIACIFMGVELFGANALPYLAIACIVSYLTSGSTGIYKSQIISFAKNNEQEFSETTSLDNKMK